MLIGFSGFLILAFFRYFLLNFNAL